MLALWGLMGLAGLGWARGREQPLAEDAATCSFQSACVCAAALPSATAFDAGLVALSAAG